MRRWHAEERLMLRRFEAWRLRSEETRLRYPSFSGARYADWLDGKGPGAFRKRRPAGCPTSCWMCTGHKKVRKGERRRAQRVLIGEML